MSSERVGRVFEAKFPGITVRVERSGAERLFQRVQQEYNSGIYAVDIVNTADAAHCIVWKRHGWLVPYLPEEVGPSALFKAAPNPNAARLFQNWAELP